MAGLREVFATFGIQVDSKQLEEADKKVKSFTEQLQTVGKMLATGLAAVGFTKFVTHLADTGDALNDAANRLGISTDALQELTYAAGQSGAGVDNLTSGLLLLNDRVGDALINSTGESAKAFQKYGISLRDASGNVKSADALLSDYADRIGKAKTDQEKLTIAVDAFGKQGRVMLPFLKEGSAGIAAMRKRARELGEGFSKEAVTASDDFNDALGDMGRVIQTVKGRIAVLLLPIMRRLVEIGTSVAAGFVNLTKNSAIFEAAIGVIATALAGKLIPQILNLVKALAPLAVPLAVFVGMVLVVDELITLFRGGNTIIGEFLDTLYGKGTAQNFPWDVRHILSETIEYFERLYNAAAAAFKLMSGGKINLDDIKNFNRLVVPIVGEGGAIRTDERGATQSRIREQAARAGQAVRFPGDPGYGTGTFARTVSAPVASAGTAVDARTSITVQVQGNATPETVTELERVIGNVLNRKADEVRAALVTAVPK
jgi:hypothetical protein